MLGVGCVVGGSELMGWVIVGVVVVVVVVVVFFGLCCFVLWVEGCGWIYYW